MGWVGVLILIPLKSEEELLLTLTDLGSVGSYFINPSLPWAVFSSCNLLGHILIQSHPLLHFFTSFLVGLLGVIKSPCQAKIWGLRGEEKKVVVGPVFSLMQSCLFVKNVNSSFFSPEHSWDHKGYISLASNTETLQNHLSIFQQMHSHACLQCSYCMTMQHSLVQSACFVFFPL